MLITSSVLLCHKTTEQGERDGEIFDSFFHAIISRNLTEGLRDIFSAACNGMLGKESVYDLESVFLLFPSSPLSY